MGRKKLIFVLFMSFSLFSLNNICRRQRIPNNHYAKLSAIQLELNRRSTTLSTINVKYPVLFANFHT